MYTFYYFLGQILWAACGGEEKVAGGENNNNNIGGRVETIQTTALLRTARILRRVLETWGDLLSLKLQWETIS